MEITESVLTSVKKLLGIDEGYTHFDADIVMHINSVFSILTQMGVGPANGFSITGKDEGWSDFISGGAVLPLVKSYVGLKVRSRSSFAQRFGSGWERSIRFSFFLAAFSRLSRS